MTLVKIRHGLFSFDSNTRFCLSIPALDVFPNKICALVGISGSGKTTFLRLLVGQYKLLSGTIWLADAARKMGGIGYVSQENTLIPWLTVEGNIRWAQALVDSDMLSATILTATGLNAHRMKYPDELSGGLRRRVMLAT